MRYVLIDYTNWRGERSERLVEPAQIYFGSNEWHPQHQWLMDAWDLEKQDFRTFAVKDIHSWKPEYPT